MNVHTDLSFVNLILHASVIVQAVIVLLAALSLWSWWQIFLKMFQLRRATRETTSFEDEFWQGGDLAELYKKASEARVGGGLEHIFTAGFASLSISVSDLLAPSWISSGFTATVSLLPTDGSSISPGLTSGAVTMKITSSTNITSM